MKFSEIIEHLEKGRVIRRTGWNGKSIVVFKLNPIEINSNTVIRMNSLPDDAVDLIYDTAKHINFNNYCIIYNTITGEANSWVPSSSDIFADDWVVLWR